MFLVLFTFVLLLSPVVNSACTYGACEPNCIQAAASALNFDNAFPSSLFPQLFTVVSAGFNLGHPLLNGIDTMNLILFDCDMLANCKRVSLIEDLSTRLGVLDLNVFYGMPPGGLNAGYRGFLTGRGRPNLVWFNTPCAARPCSQSELSALFATIPMKLADVTGPGKPLGIIQFDASEIQNGFSSVKREVITTFLKGGLVIGQIGEGISRDPGSALAGIGVGSRILPNLTQKADQARGPGMDDTNNPAKRIGPWTKPDVQGITNICTAVGARYDFDIFTTTSASSPMITSLAALYHTYLINNGVNAMLIPGYIASWLVAIGDNAFFHNADLMNLNMVGAGLVRPPNFRDVAFGKNFFLNHVPISFTTSYTRVLDFNITGCANVHVGLWSFIDPVVVSNNTLVPGPWHLDYMELLLLFDGVPVQSSNRPSESQKSTYHLIGLGNFPVTVSIQYNSVRIESSFRPEAYITTYYIPAPCF